MVAYTESFTSATDGPLDGALVSTDLTWAYVDGNSAGWEVVSSQASPAGANRGITNRSRAEHDTTAADQYALLSVVALGAHVNTQTGPAVRFDPASDTWYAAVVRGDGSVVILRHTPADGTAFPELTTPVAVDITNLPKVLRTEVEGSTVRAYWDGVKVAEVVDTTIAGFTRGGLWGHEQSSSLQVTVDNFEFGDLAASAAVALDGSAPAAASATGATAVDRPLTGSSPAAGGATGALEAERALTGAAPAASTAAAGLSATRALAGAGNAAATATGALGGTRPLDGSAAAAGGATGVLTVAPMVTPGVMVLSGSQTSTAAPAIQPAQAMRGIGRDTQAMRGTGRATPTMTGG